MSIYSAMKAGVSGLSANAAAMASISDNITNASTVGFKRVQTEFSSMVKGDAPAGSFNAAGVTTSQRRMVDMQGNFEQTRSATDLAIDGGGFFVVTQNPAGSGAEALFTRAGSFALDSEGRMVNAQGLYLLGAPIDRANPNPVAPTTIAALQPITLANVTSGASATTDVAVNANLDSRQAQYDPTAPGATPYDAGDMSLAPTDPAYVRPHVERTLEIFDSLGTVRTLNISFLKTSTPLNTWAAEISYTDPATGARTLAWAGEADFSDTGVLQTITPATGQPSIEAVQIQWTTTTPPPPAGSGAATSLLDFDLSRVSQFAQTSALNSVIADGGPPGTLIGVDVSANGILSAQFSNGRNEQLFLLPIATFTNPNGLTPERGGAFRASLDGGEIAVNAAGDGGAGQVRSNSLEQSNVDLGTEFTNLIVTQRAYSASSRVITTADEMLEELLRIKR